MGMARYSGYPGNKKCLKIADYKIMYATPSQIIAFPCLSVNSQMIDLLLENIYDNNIALDRR